MVFLPVGDKGILVVLGGVSVPDPVWMLGYGVRNYTTNQLKAQAVSVRDSDSATYLST